MFPTKARPHLMRTLSRQWGVVSKLESTLNDRFRQKIVVPSSSCWGISTIVDWNQWITSSRTRYSDLVFFITSCHTPRMQNFIVRVQPVRCSLEIERHHRNIAILIYQKYNTDAPHTRSAIKGRVRTASLSQQPGACGSTSLGAALR